MRTVLYPLLACALACTLSLVALNERASRSPLAVLAQKNAGSKYVALPSFHDKQGTNRAFIEKFDGEGQSTKGRIEMLADIRGSGAARRASVQLKKKGGKGIVVLPDAGEMGTDKAFVNKGDGDGLGHTAKLSGFGTNTAFMNKGDGKDQSTKGRIEMLADIRGSGAARRAASQVQKKGSEGFITLPDAGDMGTNKAFINKGDGKGLGHTSKLSGFGTDTAFMNKGDGKDQSTKGRVEMLADIRGSAAAARAARSKRHYAPLPNAGGFGTDAAFLHKADGAHQSTKARVEMLADIRGSGAARRVTEQKRHYVPLPEAGGFGTDAAFLHKADGAGQSTKGKMQQLYEWTADMEGTYLPASDFYTGAGTKMISGAGAGHPWTGLSVDETNLGGIPGTGPANVLPFESAWVPSAGH